jgi:hypothetical protein
VHTYEINTTLGGLTFEVCQPDVFTKQRKFIRFLNRQRLNIVQAWKKQAIVQQSVATPVNDVQPPTHTKPTRGHRPKQRSVHFHDTPKSEVLRQNSAESKRTSTNGILQKSMGCLQGSYIYVRVGYRKCS